MRILPTNKTDTNNSFNKDKYKEPEKNSKKKQPFDGESFEKVLKRTLDIK
jgi:hypothetical protein